ncbi:MAG TPA: FkbM family methyltransferase [Methanoregulaceae archaeon]|nr:FkbM family methyltransferase [Methanoregulaceae archaeon]HQP82364.1 FkbM family methyltransferase [Methanoregulaceae archaeon]
MIKNIKEYLRLINDLWRIEGYDILMKLDLFKSYLKIDFLTKFSNKPIIELNILNRKISYFNNFIFKIAFHEIFIKQEYKDFKPDNDSPLIFDCGANVGLATIYFKKFYPNSKIFAFEPDEEIFALLKKNTIQNSLDNVNIFNLALSDSKGVKNFFYDENRKTSNIGSGSLIEERNPKNRKNVETGILSEYIGNQMVDFVKMDIEGSEYSVINELANSNKLKNIKELTVEYHHKIGKEKSKFSEFLRIFEMNEFEYQIRSNFLGKNEFQDILIYFFRALNG